MNNTSVVVIDRKKRITLTRAVYGGGIASIFVVGLLSLLFAASASWAIILAALSFAVSVVGAIFAVAISEGQKEVLSAVSANSARSAGVLHAIQRDRLASYLGAAIGRRQEGDPIDPDDEREIAFAVDTVSKLREFAPGAIAMLWVDDDPGFTIWERRAFEAAGLMVSLAYTTLDALQLLNEDPDRFSLIVSDMGRAEGKLEGLVLLNEMRNLAYSTPLIIYSTSNSAEHWNETVAHGGLGSTNDPLKLFTLAMGAIYEQ